MFTVCPLATWGSAVPGEEALRFIYRPCLLQRMQPAALLVTVCLARRSVFLLVVFLARNRIKSGSSCVMTIPSLFMHFKVANLSFLYEQ